MIVKTKKLKFNKKIFLQSLAVFLMIFYAYTSGLQGYIYRSYVVVLMTFVIALLVMVQYNGRRIKPDITGVLLIGMLIVMLVNNKNIENGYYDSLYYSVTIFIFYFFARKSMEWHLPALKITELAGVFYAFMTVFLMAMPSIYKNVVNPLFSSSGYSEQMLRLYDQGYMPGFTPHYSTNGMYLAVGLAVPIAYLVSKSINKEEQKKYLGYFIFILLALLLTGKRAHTVFAVVSLLFCYYFMNCDKPLERWFKIILILAVGALGIILVSEFVPGVLNVINRFTETMENGNLSMGRDIWRAAALELFSSHKLLGIGWDGFRYYLVSGSNTVCADYCFNHR